jgi:hypothetical protein
LQTVGPIYYTVEAPLDIDGTPTHSATPQVGIPMTLTNTITSSGPTATIPSAVPVTLTEQLGTSLTFNQAGTSAACTYNAQTTVVTCTAASLTTAGTTFTISVTPTSTNNVILQPQITGGGSTNTSGGNDSFTPTNPTAILSAVISPNYTTYLNGKFAVNHPGQFVVTTVSNTGIVGTTGPVTVALALSATLGTATSAAGAGWTCSTPEICSSNANLAANSSIAGPTFTIAVGTNDGYINDNNTIIGLSSPGVPPANAGSYTLSNLLVYGPLSATVQAPFASTTGYLQMTMGSPASVALTEAYYPGTFTASLGGSPVACSSDMSFPNSGSATTGTPITVNPLAPVGAAGLCNVTITDQNSFSTAPIEATVTQTNVIITGQ